MCLYKLFGLLSKLLASLIRNYFPERPSGAPLHTLSKLYDVPVGFAPPLFWGCIFRYLRSLNGGCCSISDDLSCSYLSGPVCLLVVERTSLNYKMYIQHTINARLIPSIHCWFWDFFTHYICSYARKVKNQRCPVIKSIARLYRSFYFFDRLCCVFWFYLSAQDGFDF